MTELLKPTEFLTREGARLGAMQGFYFKMAANLHQRLGPAVAAAKLAEQALLSAQHDEEQYYAKLWEACDTENAAVGISIEIIVFCAMSLEAAIYDYAAWHLGDTYVQSHLDKLDLLSKWLVVPRLITGRAIPVGRPPL